MSLDKSLKSKGTLTRRRNVLSREERITRLLNEERRQEGESVFGLPKVKPRVMAAPRKPKKAKETAQEETVAGAPASEQ